MTCVFGPRKFNAAPFEPTTTKLAIFDCNGLRDGILNVNGVDDAVVKNQIGGLSLGNTLLEAK